MASAAAALPPKQQMSQGQHTSTGNTLYWQHTHQVSTIENLEEDAIRVNVAPDPEQCNPPK
jgi:hypothetical protein